MNEINKEYLGDAVFIEEVGDKLKLTTSDGYSDTNTIYLEREVLMALLGYAGRNGFIPDQKSNE